MQVCKECQNRCNLEPRKAKLPLIELDHYGIASSFFSHISLQTLNSGGKAAL